MADHLRSSPSTSTTKIQVGRWRKFIDTARKWLGAEEEGEWLKDMRGNLAMVATVIATMTFQIGLNPPGGVVQNEDNGFVGCTHKYTKDRYACPGESVYAAAYPYGFSSFILFDSISFFSSLIVCLWLVSGLPLNHRLPAWLLAIAMCISLSSLAVTFLFGVHMIAPIDILGNHYGNSAVAYSTFSFLVWCVAVGIVGLFLVMRFVFWLVSIRSKRSNASITPGDETQVNRST